MIVLDASAALEIAKGTIAGKQAEDLVLGADKVIAPTLFVSETANTTWKYSKFSKSAKIDWLEFFTITLDEIDEYVSDSELFPEALSAAMQLNHSVYDMLYLVLARRTSSSLVTCDQRLAALCEQCKVQCIQLVDLGKDQDGSVQ